MSGLYQRALEIYRQSVGLPLAPKAAKAAAKTASIEDVSPTEREQILHEMDEVVAGSRIRVDADTFRLSPRHSGAGLPLLINVAAVAVLVAAVVVSSLALNRQEKTLAAAGGSFLSAEGKLIEALRQESQRELAEKDRAVLEAQARLAEVSQERERLRSQTADAIRQREEQLAAQLARTLEAERARLQAQGLSATSVDQRLAAFEAQRRAELDSQAEAFRRQVQEEAARQERAISELSGRYEQSLREAQEQRAAVEKDLQARQAELQQQVRLQSDRTQSLERERAELTRLQAAQGRENLVLDQLLNMYDTVNRRIAAGQDTEALQGLAAMREYLDQEPARSLPGIQRRRPVEAFLIGSLEELIESRQARQERQTAAAVLEAGAKLEALRVGIRRAEERFQAGDYAAARGLYLAALAEVPEAARGEERLARLREMEAERGRRSALELAAAGAAAYGEARWRNTLDRYQEAVATLLGDPALASRLVAQVGRATVELERQNAPAAPLAAQTAALQAEQTAALKQYAEQVRALQEENARLSALNATLRSREAQSLAAGEEEQRAAQRVLDAYQAVNRSLQASRYGEAAARLQQLRASLDQEPARSLPGMQGRRPVELFLISSLEELIAARTRQGETSDEGARRTARFGAALQQAEASYGQGQWQASLDQYRQALALLLADGAAARRVTEQVAEAGYQQKAAPLRAGVAQRETLRSQLETLQAQYAQERVGSARSSLSSPESLATLLQAKLLTLQILSSEPVASSHPQLYDQLQQYLDSFASQQTLDGRYSALQDVLGILDNALGTQKTPSDRLAEIWRRYVHTDRDDLLEELFERLQTLLK